MAKSSPRKSLKSLFSRSEANLAAAPEKDADKSEGDKKKFKFFKFKTKSKSGSASEKTANVEQKALSAVDPSITAEEMADNFAANNKRSLLYGTAPRSKDKGLSYSEMDLRKPKRFATFSFGLRKRKKKYDDDISKSTFGLHSPGIEEEAPLDFSQMEVDQANTKKRFSMSQPELDTCDTFDIPSPPPVATNQAESYFTLNKSESAVAMNGQQNGSDVVEEPLRAPIATIPELQLYDRGSSEEKGITPVHEKPFKRDSNLSAVLPGSQPPVELGTSDHKAAVLEPDHGPCDADILQHTPKHSPEVTLSHADGPETALHGQPSLASVGSKANAPVLHADGPVPNADSASDSQEVTNLKSIPETAKSATTASSATRPVNQDAVYGALYESLFPQSFTAEVISSLLNPPPQIRTELRRLDTKLEPVMVKTRDECHTETNVLYSRLTRDFDSAAGRMDGDVSGYTDRNAISREREGTSSNSSLCQTSTTSESRTDPDGHSYSSLYSGSEPGYGKNIPYSELTHSLSEVKPDTFSHNRDTLQSVPVIQNAAPPVSVYVTSQETDTQVTDSIRRVILVKESVTDEKSAHTGFPSEKMSAGKNLGVKIETAPPPRQMDGLDGPLSPTYLSVGSDDGSAVEIYYSAEEDNGGSGDEEMYTVEEREEVKEVPGTCEVFLKQEEVTETATSKRDDGGFRGVIVKMQDEGGDMGKDGKFPTVQQQRGQSSEDRAPESDAFLLGNDGKSQEEEVATAAFPQVKKERQVERKEELLDTPVQQGNKVMECDFAPPSRELHGQGEGTWARALEPEDHLDGEKQLPGQEIRYLACKDGRRSEDIHGAVRNTREEDGFTPEAREADEQVLEESGQKRGDVSDAASAVADCPAGVEAVTAALTRCADLQSDATETEHNRAAPSSEWVDTITPSADRTGTVLHQVAVELSALNTARPPTDAADALPERHVHPGGAQLDLNQGSLRALRSPTAASDVFESEYQPNKADQESVDKMNLGYSSLSTKLSLKSPSPQKEDESKHRFRKVSLVGEEDGAETSQDTVDVSKTSTTVSEFNGEEPDYRWKNRFHGVSQYDPNKTEDSSHSDSLSSGMSGTSGSSSLSSSAVPETIAYKYHGNAHSSSSSSSSASSPLPEEGINLGNRLNDRTGVYPSHEGEPAGERKDEWRRSLVEQEEPAAPAGERERQKEGEPERIKSRWESQPLPSSSCSPGQQISQGNSNSFEEDNDDSSRFSGVFQATLVELVSDPAAPPSSPPASPDTDSTNQFDMDNLVDTLKSMGPSLRPKITSARAAPPALVSSLPPIVEDAPSPVTTDTPDAGPTKKIEAASNGLYALPADLGLRWSSPRDSRSPLDLMKHNQNQLQPGPGGLNSPLRSSASNSIVMGRSSDSDSHLLNGNGLLQSPGIGSRLDNSVIFAGQRSASIDQTLDTRQAHRSLFRTGSLPESGLMGAELGSGTDPAGSRYERFSFLLNTSSSTSGSLTGAEDPNGRMSRPPSILSSPPSNNSPTRLLSPTGSIDLQRPLFTHESPQLMFGQTQGIGMGAGTGRLGTAVLQRSFSGENIAGAQQSSLFNNVHGGPQFQSQEPEPEKNLVSKYRAFPDAYLTKEKEHGKLNPRPGKVYIFDRPGMCGQRIEVRGDIVDATPWELQETISIRVIRGGWVLYEKPNFKGEKIALDEGDLELTYPFNPSEEQQQNGHDGGKQQNGDTSDAQAESKPARKFIIGSIRRAVRDYSVPEISLFPEENAEGKKVVFRDTSEDARIFGFPIKANSVIVNAGLWLVYAHPFFQGVPRVLEVGGYSTPEAWGVEKPYVGSLHPLKVGEPRVENMSEPKLVIYDKPYFSGKSRTIMTNMKDFMTRTDRQQTTFMYSVGSLKVLGGIWVGYEKDGFRGHQYLLEEGEYHDWRVWGGCDSELRSVRLIQADLTDPLMVMFEQPEEEQDGMPEENTFEVTEAIPDVELFEYKTSSRSIHVLSGAWIAYSHVDFSGNQYILEKGFYNNCADWGSQDNRICSVQPILLAASDTRIRNEIIMYSEPDFQGECQVIDRNQDALSEKPLTKSCRVSGGSWVVYEDKQYSGNLYVLSEGDYPNLTSMGCPPDFTIRSAKVVPMTFSVPSISLFGLECLEGREITTETEIISMTEEGFNSHILSVRVNNGCWVICEHSNYRGRQFLLEPIEITNWLKFSSLQTVGSMYPVRQKRRFFRMKNKETGHVMSVQGGVEEMKSGRVVVTPEVEPMSDIWFYQDGLIKNKLAPNMSLQVMGNIEPAAKVVLWTETRQPIQTWKAQMRGLITSLTFPGMVLDIKGGKTYDKNHLVILPEDEERPSQQWEIDLL